MSKLELMCERVLRLFFVYLSNLHRLWRWNPLLGWSVMVRTLPKLHRNSVDVSADSGPTWHPGYSPVHSRTRRVAQVEPGGMGLFYNHGSDSMEVVLHVGEAKLHQPACVSSERAQGNQRQVWRGSGLSPVCSFRGSQCLRTSGYWAIKWWSASWGESIWYFWTKCYVSPQQDILSMPREDFADQARCRPFILWILCS
jgi:hypothetical protein